MPSKIMYKIEVFSVNLTFKYRNDPGLTFQGSRLRKSTSRCAAFLVIATYDKYSHSSEFACLEFEAFYFAVEF